MAQTRASTGSSRPRVFAAVEEAVTGKKTKAKANTSKPRAKKVTTGRVEKKKTTPAKTTTTTTTTTKPAAKTVKVKKTPAKVVKDKVEGKAKKVAGAVEGRPAKKVRDFSSI